MPTNVEGQSSKDRGGKFRLCPKELQSRSHYLLDPHLKMDWERLAAVDVFQLERNESLLDSLYAFLEKNELSAAEAARVEPGQLAKTLSVVQRIMKVEKTLQQ